MKVRFARTLLVRNKTRKALKELEKLIAEGKGEFVHSVDTFYEKVKKVAGEAEKDFNRLSSGVCSGSVKQKRVLLNSVETGDLVRPLLYVAQEDFEHYKICTRLARRIPKIPNPNYVPYFAGNHKPGEISAFCFDKFDLLTHLAKQVGGNMCCKLANTALVELGHLRDVGFVFSYLKSKKYKERLNAVACLIFLGDPEYCRIFEKLTLKDPDAEVRRAALWGCALLKNDSLHSLLKLVEQNDSDDYVISLARRIKGCKTDLDIWKI